MKRILCVFLLISILITLVGCKDKDEDVIAMIDDHEIYMSDIEDDITFLSQMLNIDTSDQTAVDNLVMDVIETYFLDYVCKTTLEELGLTYNKDYYGASYEMLIEAYGSEATLIKTVQSFGLEKTYLEELCKKQARRATLTEYLTETYKKTLNITDEDVLTYYIQNSESFTVDEVRTFYYLAFASKDEATAALAEISQNGFMAYYEAEDKSEQGEGRTAFYGVLEHCEKNWFPTTIGTVLFNLPVGTHYPEPLGIFSDAGYAILYAYESLNNYKFTYDEMKDSLKEALIEDAVDKYLEDFFTNINERHEVAIYYGVEK